MLTLRKLAIALLPCIALTSCTQDSGFSTAQMPIINGQPAPDENYGAVVSLSIRADKHYYTFCTGTLIRDDAILTAAHCVSDTDDFPFSRFHNNQQVQILTGQNVENPSVSDIYEIDRIQLHPDFSPQKTQFDLAVVFLKTPVPEHIKPLPIFEEQSRLSLLAHQSQRVEFVGYGSTEHGSDGERKSADGSLLKYCPYKKPDSLCGIETPLGEHHLIPPGSFFHDLSTGGACLGDSGGPVLIKENGEFSLIGVVAYGDADCKTYAVTTSVADFAPWIRNTLDPPPEDDCSASSLYAFRHNSSGRAPLFMVCCAFIGLGCLWRRREKITESLGQP